MTVDSGIFAVPSCHSVNETIERAKDWLRAKGVKMFALIDHDGEARAAGLQMRPTKVLLFGSPVVGTPLMIASPSIAIDLPLKLLVWEDEDAQVWISHTDSAYLQARHDVPPKFAKLLAGMELLATSVSEEVRYA